MNGGGQLIKWGPPIKSGRSPHNFQLSRGNDFDVDSDNNDWTANDCFSIIMKTSITH